MAKPPAAGDRPGVTVVDISDPTDANAGVELLDLDAIQLQSIPMRVRRAIVRLDSAAVVFHSTNFRVRTRTPLADGLRYDPVERRLPIPVERHASVMPAKTCRALVVPGPRGR